MKRTDEHLILDRLAQLATGPWYAARQRLEQVTAKIAELEPIACNGSFYWRDADIPGKTPKLYIIHRHGETCPVHGKPKLANSRVRVYVGADPDRQDLARSAIESYETLTRYRKEHRNLEHAIASAYYHIKLYYRELGYTVPQFPNEYPEPRRENHQW